MSNLYQLIIPDEGEYEPLASDTARKALEYVKTRFAANV